MLEGRLDIPHLFDDEHWQQCLEDFLLRTYDRSESVGSFRIYRLHLRRLFSDPSRPADDYTTHEISAFIHAKNEHTGKPVSSATLNQKHAVVACFYRFASTYPVKRDNTGKPKPLFTDIPPTASIQRRKPARNYKAFAEGELERFFQAIEDTMIDEVSRQAKRYGISFDPSKFAAMDTSHQHGYIKQMTAHNGNARRALLYPFVVALRDLSLFYLYLTSARRRAEIRSLRLQDIEQATFVEHGIARKGHLFRFHNKGHGAHMDACEMAESAYTLLMQYLTYSGRLIEPGEYVFCGAMILRRGGQAEKPLADGVLQNAFRRYADRARIPRSRSIHSFRHSSARIRAEQGADIRAIQRVLRHKNLATTSLYLDDLIAPPDPDVGLVEQQFAVWAK